MGTESVMGARNLMWHEMACRVPTALLVARRMSASDFLGTNQLTWHYQKFAFVTASDEKECNMCLTGLLPMIHNQRTTVESKNTQQACNNIRKGKGAKGGGGV